MSSIALCIDFDGTIVEKAYPEIGKAKPRAFEVMKKLRDAGYLLVLWTCREGEELANAVRFCYENGVVFNAINETYAGEEWRNGLSRKPYCHTFIDDKNLGGFPGWSVVERLLLQDREPANDG